MGHTTFQSDIFPVQQIELGGETETILVGGKHLYPLLPEALRGVEEIGVLGWGSQAPAQALNLRDSLAGTGIRISVGLRPGSPSRDAARAAGFREDAGTLGDIFDVAARADLVLLLVSDAAQAELYPKIFDALQPGSTLGLSHGFLAGHLRAMKDDFPEGVNVIGVCPAFARVAFPAADAPVGGAGEDRHMHRFLDHPLHAVLETLSALRPTVAISVD